MAKITPPAGTGSGGSGASVPDSWITAYGADLAVDGSFQWTLGAGVGADFAVNGDDPTFIDIVPESNIVISVDWRLTQSAIADGMVYLHLRGSVIDAGLLDAINQAVRIPIRPTAHTALEVEGCWTLPPVLVPAASTFGLDYAIDLGAGTVTSHFLNVSIKRTA